MTRRAKVHRMLSLRAGSRYGRGWAVWVYIEDSHYISGDFSIHPTWRHAMDAATIALAVTGQTTDSTDEKEKS